MKEGERRDADGCLKSSMKSSKGWISTPSPMQQAFPAGVGDVERLKPGTARRGGHRVMEASQKEKPWGAVEPLLGPV